VARGYSGGSGGWRRRHPRLPGARERRHPRLPGARVRRGKQRGERGGLKGVLTLEGERRQAADDVEQGRPVVALDGGGTPVLD
jgi:hypothetical protein